MITDLSIIKNVEPLFKYKVIIYGTGEYGKTFFHELELINIHAIAFVDTYPKVNKLLNLPVFSQEKLEKYALKENILIILASSYFNEIYEDLQEKKITGRGIITAFSVRYALFLNIGKNYIGKKETELCQDIISVWKKLKIEKINAKQEYKQFEKLTNILNGNNILIYQPGKVGSSSIYDSLKKIKVMCEHLHIINNENAMLNNHYKQLVQRVKEKKLKIITGVREPISRVLSSYVYIMQYYIWLLDEMQGTDLLKDFIQYIYKDYYNITLKQRKIQIALLGNEFLWFDRELKKIFEIDIFQYPFDKEKGYSIIKKDNIEVFVYKLEKLNNLEEELGKFIGIENFKLYNSNSTNEMITKYIYKELKETIKVPKEYLNYYFENNEKLEHFYTKRNKYIYKKLGIKLNNNFYYFARLTHDY